MPQQQHGRKRSPTEVEAAKAAGSQPVWKGTSGGANLSLTTEENEEGNFRIIKDKLGMLGYPGISLERIRQFKGNFKALHTQGHLDPKNPSQYVIELCEFILKLDEFSKAWPVANGFLTVLSKAFELNAIDIPFVKHVVNPFVCFVAVALTFSVGVPVTFLGELAVGGGRLCGRFLSGCKKGLQNLLSSDDEKEEACAAEAPTVCELLTEDMYQEDDRSKPPSHLLIGKELSAAAQTPTGRNSISISSTNIQHSQASGSPSTSLPPSPEPVSPSSSVYRINVYREIHSEKGINGQKKQDQQQTQTHKEAAACRGGL